MTTVDARHVPALLASAGKSIAGMPEGRKVVDQMRKASSKQDLLFLLRSADLGVADPARAAITLETERAWRDVQAALVRSAEMQLHELFSANA